MAGERAAEVYPNLNKLPLARRRKPPREATYGYGILEEFGWIDIF
jgi:hypothetical protein